MRCQRLKSPWNSSQLTRMEAKVLNNGLQGPQQFALPFCPHLLPLPCSLAAQLPTPCCLRKTPACTHETRPLHWLFPKPRHSSLTSFESLLFSEAFPDHLIKICICPSASISLPRFIFLYSVYYHLQTRCLIYPVTICLPSQEWKLRECRNGGLFCWLRYLQGLDECLVHSKCSIHAQYIWTLSLLHAYFLTTIYFLVNHTSLWLN